MKKLIAVLFLCTVPLLESIAQDIKQEASQDIVPDSAQETSESPHHFEAGAGFNLITNYVYSRFSFTGPGVFFEYRFREKSKFDAGAHVDYKFARARDFILDYEDVIPNVSYNLFNTKIFFDYNFCPRKKVNPYLGLSGGLGLIYINRTNQTKNLHFIYTLAPRAGVQIGQFRLTCEFDLISSKAWTSRTVYYRYGRSSRGYVVYSTILAVNLGYEF